ncbi:tetratricopeptide repeat protein, partial [Duganella sp. FT80W]
AEAVTAAATAAASATPGRASGSARAGGSNNTSNTSTPPAGGAKAAADGAVNADKARSAARARSRAAATATAPAGLDPERLRIYGLVALLVLVVGGLGLYYWRALSGPGAGAELPPIPMPPAGATGATPAQTVSAALAAGAAPAAGDAQAQGADDPMLAPQTGVNRAAQQELERRVAQTEQALQAAVQSMQAATAPRPEQLPPLAAPDNGEIRVARSLQPSPVAPALDSAYQAFNSGDTAGAQQQYEAALAQDPNNRDALLGAAHVAARQNQSDKAAGYYLHLLELSPNDADATAGLVGLRQGDSRQSENRLKAILNNNPDAAPVLFALGNLYAQQSRWPEAQQAYFRAVDAAPDNPDYAYNLAVGLDRLNQPKLAQTYYQRALALAQDKAVGFDRAALRKRLHELNTAGH